jgi:8-oxo-dGTP pyrophosphatase MutT (NUDIX family)
MEPTDNMAYRFPVSVKGVVFRGSTVVLLRNERNEWELPGGKLELDEAPEECVARELEEELSVRVSVGPILDVWVYRIREGTDVVIVTYGCHAGSWPRNVGSSEAREVGFFESKDIPGLEMPTGYKRSIRDWSKILKLEPG